MTLRGRPKRERRRHPRALTNFSAILVVGGRLYSARVINLSMGGALLDMGPSLPTPAIAAGKDLQVDIRCRGGGLGPLHLDAQAVAWNPNASQVPLSGVATEGREVGREGVKVPVRSLPVHGDRLLAVQFGPMSVESAEILEELMFEALYQLHGRLVADG